MTGSVKHIQNKALQKAGVCCLFLLLMTMSCHAAHEKGSSRLNLSAYTATNNGIFLRDDKFNLLSVNMSNYSSVSFFDQSYKNSIIFGIDHTITNLGTISSSLTNNVFRAEIDVLIISNTFSQTGNNLANTVSNQVRTFTVSFSGFNVHNSGSAPAIETDIDAYNFTNSYQTLVIINAIRIYNSYSSTTPLSTANIPANLYVELQSDAERYYTLDNSGLSAFSFSTDLQVQYLTSVSTGNEIEVKWKHINGAESYELEWLWLDEYTYGNGTVTANPSWNNAPELNFRNNSTRIRTDQNMYHISNVYESGHMFFRIRAAGSCLAPAALVNSGSPAITDYYTDWTWPDTASIPAQPGGYTTVGITGASVPWYIDLRPYAHENDKNWIYVGSYAEQGKKKEAVTYFDGAQYSRQTVTRNNTDNVAIVGETYYDYAGRPTITALPTPIDDATLKFYQQNLSGGGTAFNFKAGTTMPFDKQVFSVASASGVCSLSAIGLDNNYGTGQYYSSNNPFQSMNYNNGFTPDAESYPFMQTEYLPDNTGRITRQSGVGKALKIQTTGVAHDTRYMYGSVNQDELDRLFGSEAGNASHYTKKITIDPNGIITIDYMNQEGKTVATAVSGSEPSNQDALLSSAGNVLSGNYQMETDLLNKTTPSDYDTPVDANQLEDDALVFNESLAIASAQTYSFNYSLVNLNNSFTACPSVCYDCVYDLEFDIKDNCGNRPTGFTPISITAGTVSGTYSSSLTSSNPTAGINHTGGDNPVSFSFQQIVSGGTSMTVSLDAGMYTISKRLTVNQQALNWYLDDYLANCVASPATYSTAEAINLDTSGCNVSCSQCAAKLGGMSTFTANLAAQNSSVTTAEAIAGYIAEYNAAVATCYEPCQQDDNCTAMIEIMLTDIAPNGQYAEFSGAGSALNASSFPLSVFNVDTKLPRRNGVITEPWRNPVNYQTAQTYYVDENGAQDKVTVRQISVGSYDPPLIAGATVSLVSGTIDFYYADPEKLLYAGDFVANFKSSWAKSLLKYHPEYPYAVWCIQNKTQTITPPIIISSNNYNATGTATVSTSACSINTGFGFDSLYNATDDIDDIASSSYSTVFNPLAYDPYWSTTGVYYVAGNTSDLPGVTLPNTALNTDNMGIVFQRQSTTSSLPADFTNTVTTPNMHFNERGNKTANNRFLNYKGTNYSILQVAAFMATPLAGQPAQSITSQWSAFTASAGSPASYYANSLYVPNFSNPMDPNWILGLTMQNASAGDDSYKRKAWDNFKNLYLSLKQEMETEAVQSYVMNSAYRGCNDCIGEADFDVNSVKYTTYSNLIFPQLIAAFNSTIPISIGINTGMLANMSIASQRDWYKYPTTYTLNKEQECGLLTKDLYRNKVKRFTPFTSSSVDVNTMAANNAAGIYQQTGLCPNAYDLQDFLNGMAHVNGFFSSGLDLNVNVPAFSQNLFKAILPVIPTTYTAPLYNFSVASNPDYFAFISIGVNTNNLKLSMPSASGSAPVGILDWNNYQGPSPTYTLSGFSNLRSNSVNNFAVVATILADNGTAAPLSYTLNMTGNTYNISLTGCSFSPPCKPNGTGSAVNALLNTFSGNAKFPAPYNGGYITGYLSSPAASPFTYVFTNSFKPLLETSGNSDTSWKWTYSTTVVSTTTVGDIFIFDGNNANKRMKISFTFPSGPNISCYQSFHNFRPDPSSSTGGFLIDAMISNIATISACPPGSIALSGTVSVGTCSNTGTSIYSYTPLDIGGCSFDLNTCSTAPHQVKKDFEQWVLTSGSGFTTMITSAVQDISNNLYLTALLRSYLNNPVNTSTNGPLQNYFWWYRDAVNTNTNQIAGWICITNSSTAPTSPPTDGCQLIIKRKNTGTLAISTLLSDLGTSFTPLDPSQNNSFYSALLAPGGNGTSNDELLISTTCFPMRSCDSPTCTTGAGILIQGFNVPGYAPFTLTDTFGNNLTLNTYSAGTTASVSMSNNSAVLSDLASVSFTPNTPAILCGTGTASTTCTFTSSSLINSLNASNVVDNMFSEMVFLNNDICPSGTCCSATTSRKVYYDQTFSVSTAGNYDLSFMTQDLPSNWICGHNNLAPESVRTYVDNILVNTTSIPQNSSPTIYFSIPNVLSAGTHSLRIVWDCNHLSNIYRVYPISIYNRNHNLAALPCPATNDIWPTDTMPVTDYIDPCADFLKDLTDNSANEKYKANLDSLKNTFSHKYISKCLGRAIETLTMRYNMADYHYTLYYYDQEGNLVRTVPPEGVKVIDLAASFSGGGTNRQAIKDDRASYGTYGYTKKIYTQHRFQTTYNYNSLNQLVKQETPDAGISKFYYDNLGRLVASQNAQQKYQGALNAPANQVYSFTRYDALGRINMVGQIGTYDLDAYPLTVPATIKDILSDPGYPFNLSYFNGSIREVTQTYYGDGAGSNAINIGSTFSIGNQLNIRNRVCSVSIENTYDANDATYDHATHYSYDIHGNVKELIQENTALSGYALTQQKLKNIQYSYDLISGNVNCVIYQNGQPDMMIHKYLYDAGNRITNVFTSRNGLLWDQDAKYYYYLHGPLARTELGEHKVQGTDYAYTLQGWLKGVNSESLKATNDMGKDGYGTLTGTASASSLNHFGARDGFGFGLSYFNDFADNTDYKPINNLNGTASYFLAGLNPDEYAAPDLYNGNISHLSSAYLNPATPVSLANVNASLTVNHYDPYSFLKYFKYDPLNRITSTAVLAEAVDGNNSWNYTKTGNLSGEYAETFRYDENGNILKLGRTLSSGQQFDDLTYYYYDAAGAAFNPAVTTSTNPTNKLAYVDDAGSNMLSDDIKDQPPGNYTYDKVGNLIADAASNIFSIQWTIYGKIKSIVRSNFPAQPNLEFCYDATGNRISKKVSSSTSTVVTYYVRDAQGNVMATYNENVSGSYPGFTKTLTLTELDLYGSSRLGIKNCSVMTGYILSGTNQPNTAIPAASEEDRVLGLKSYELCNHLGNVLAVVSDRKLAADDNTDGTVDYFLPDMLSATDYMAFGSPMPNRQFNNDSYRYGFEGQEKDNEVYGDGNSLSFEYRVEEPRLGRFLSIDPLTAKYPWYTPYQFAGNNPIWAKDIEGLEPDKEMNANESLKNTSLSDETLALGPNGECYSCGQQKDDGKKNASLFTTSSKAMDFIKDYENFEPNMYNDQADNATIGYGYLIHYGKVGTDLEAEKPYKNGIDKDEATNKFKTDIVPYENTVKSSVKTPITQSQFDALVSFQYNTGALKGSTLLKRINTNETNSKITEAFLMWNKVTEKGKKVESTGLTKRRTDEAEMFNKGDYERTK